MPSSNRALRSFSKAPSRWLRFCTARADAMPKLSLYCRPEASSCRSPGLSCVPANQEPIMTWLAPAARARATSRG